MDAGSRYYMIEVIEVEHSVEVADPRLELMTIEEIADELEISSDAASRLVGSKVPVVFDRQARARQGRRLALRSDVMDWRDRMVEKRTETKREGLE